MAGNKIFNTDLDITGKIKVTNVPNRTGTVMTYDTTSKEISTRTHSEIISDLGLITATNIAAAYYTKTQLQTPGQAQVNWGNLTNVPPTFTPAAHTHPWTDITSKPTTLSGYGITDALPLSGGQLTGQLGLLQGTGGGIIFPNDSFGGSSDSASIKLLNPAGGEATEMTFTMTNDADDIINFSVPSIDGVKINRYTVWNAGNFNPDSKANTSHTHNISDVSNLQTALDNINNDIENLEGINYVWSPTNRTLTLFDRGGNQLSQVSLVSLDNEGTDLRYNSSTLSLELYNADNELLDSIPVSSFVGSVGTQLQLNSNELQLKDSQGNILSTVSFTVSNIQGLQTALNNKLEKGGYDGTAQDLKNDIENIQIGGRNLIRHQYISNKPTYTDVSYDKNNNEWTGNVANGADPTWGAGFNISAGNNIRVPYGRTYITSFEVFSPVEVTWAADVNCYPVSGPAWYGNDNDNNGQRKQSSRIIPANQWTKCWFSYENSSGDNVNKVDLYDDSNFGIINNTGNTLQIKYRNIKGELANKPSEWTPAPEDVEALINQEIQDVENKITGLETTVNTTFKDGIIEQAEAKAIEKYINSLNAEKSDIDNQYNIIYDDALLVDPAKQNLFNQKSSYDTAHSQLITSINTAIADGKTNADEKKDVDSKFTNYKNVLGGFAIRLTEALKAIEAKRIDIIQIGGRNYYPDGDFSKGVNHYVGGNNVKTFGVLSTDFDGNALPWNGSKCFSIYTDTAGDTYAELSSIAKVDVGDYMLSFFYKSAGSIIGNSSYLYINGVASGLAFSIANDSQWYKVELPINLSSKSDIKFRIGFNCSAPAWINVTRIKLEKGNKATDWTPAPEDKQDRLQDITGYIGVGKSDTIATEKLDVNGNVKATSFIKSGGTSTQFLMADGSVNNTPYITKNSLNTVSTGWAIQNPIQESGIEFINDSYPALVWGVSSAYMSDKGWFYLEGAGINQLDRGYTNNFSGEVNINNYLNVGGGLTINGSLNSGAPNYAGYRQGGDNIILKGNSTGVSGIFFQSEEDGTNINHPSDYGYIQFHAYGIDGTTGESNRLVIGVANDADDMVVLQSPNINGVKISYLNASSGTGGTEYTVWHQGNHGAGSGLDADLLDGQDSSYFLNTSATAQSKAGSLTIGGTVTATSFFESSLRKYKTNIKKFDKSGIDLVDSLEIVTFDRIDSDVKSKIGIIADDTSDEFLSEQKDAIDLYKTIFIQSKAIQELNAKNLELEERLIKLEKLLSNG